MSYVLRIITRPPVSAAHIKTSLRISDSIFLLCVFKDKGVMSVAVSPGAERRKSEMSALPPLCDTVHLNGCDYDTLILAVIDTTLITSS